MGYPVLKITNGSGSLKPGDAARKHFPVFDRYQNPELTYLDSAASTQKPLQVINRIKDYLSYEHANIHRGAYTLSAHATELYDQARSISAKFINSPEDKCLIFTRGTTDSINFVATSFGNTLKAGDVILLTLLEHHSNIVPWQLLAERRGIKLEFAEITESAEINLEDFKNKLRTCKPKLVSFTALANSFGSVTPIKELTDLSHESGARVLVDAAQALAHDQIDVSKLGIDFLAGSGHKIYGPTGIGILYIKSDLLGVLEPYQGGGDMISEVTVEGSSWAEAPQKFEAGTPPIAEAVALGTALQFVEAIGRDSIKAHEARLLDYAYKTLSRQKDITLYGPITSGGEQASILAFNLDGIHPHDLSTVADQFGVCIRAGHHCAMPALRRLGLQSTARISFGVYNTEQDIDRLEQCFEEARKILR
ncbi:MAG: cysteine desulfurase [Candidatus Dadabacteria bacterium]|nr:MAG: cysteine desulfurase [Candidatus Dadabacteria bacterium]